MGKPKTYDDTMTIGILVDELTPLPDKDQLPADERKNLLNFVLAKGFRKALPQTAIDKAVATLAANDHLLNDEQKSLVKSLTDHP